MSYIKLLSLASFTFILLSSHQVYAKAYSLKELLINAEKSSPLLKSSDEKVKMASVAKDLAHSFHFPVLQLKQNMVLTNNPVGVFAAKLSQEDFQMSDFEISKLNNPSYRINHQTSLVLSASVYQGGAIKNQERVYEEQGHAASFEKGWVRKNVLKNIYGLYYAYYYLDELKKMLKSEERYLSKILEHYDVKTDTNKNRYLSYNQGKIIRENLREGIETLDFEKNKIKQNIVYLSGLDDFEMPSIFAEREIAKDLKNVDWKKILPQSANQKREDLLSFSRYLGSLDFEIEKEKGAYWPSINAFGEYDYHTEKFSKYGKDSSIGLMLNWTFGESTSQRVALARVGKMKAQKEYEEKNLRVQTETSALYDDLKSLQIKIERATNRAKLFEENKKILSFQYARGSVDLYNLLDNFSHHIENIIQVQKMKSDFQVKYIDYVDQFEEIL